MRRDKARRGFSMVVCLYTSSAATPIRSIRYLPARRRNCKLGLVSTGAASAIVAAMAAHSDNAPLQRTAAAAICNLAAEISCRETVAAAGAAPVLAAAMVRGLGDSALQRECCEALRHTSTVRALDAAEVR